MTRHAKHCCICRGESPRKWCEDGLRHITRREADRLHRRDWVRFSGKHNAAIGTMTLRQNREEAKLDACKAPDNDPF